LVNAYLSVLKTAADVLKFSWFFTLSGATGFLLLNRRTFNRAVGAKHAAVLWFGFEQSPASLAFVEKPASIGRHGFRFGVPTVRTSNVVALVNWSAVATVSSN
jgi:hypothetical protein